MRNLNDLNDLCNVQDVILLCEIIENRLELMYKIIALTDESVIVL